MVTTAELPTTPGTGTQVPAVFEDDDSNVYPVASAGQDIVSWFPLRATDNVGGA